ncbi:unnamed protein product [Blepharisma stoltei]|uniref:Peptidase C1A papain C-terminal domain-containing protein n=1 Tax=Blepharisma stoltei TaxID=1481888 RepID=A0AAU9JYW0_9CILI|nr:unnamed protein product [Blepharisma stoltei]
MKLYSLDKNWVNIRIWFIIKMIWILGAIVAQVLGAEEKEMSGLDQSKNNGLDYEVDIEIFNSPADYDNEKIPYSGYENEERLASYPSEWDWTVANAVTEVKNERGCNSSYIFAAVGAVESLLYLQGRTNGTLYEFSEQVILDCDKSATCKGGNISEPFNFMQTQGNVIEAFYPYEGNSYRCRFNLMPPDLLFNISGYRQIQPNNYSALYEAIRENPVAVFININSEEFFSYKSGIFNDSLCKVSPLNHAMLAVGYSENQFIRFKNSWGPDWGMDGYVLIGINNENESQGGSCGMLKYGLIPFV